MASVLLSTGLFCIYRANVLLWYKEDKWESGRGYSSIDSLKEISSFFSVTIDDLLSTEKLLSIAERENKSNLQNMSNWLIGIVDLASIMLIVLPLYPNEVNGYVYSVNLFAYTQTTVFHRLLYCGIFIINN